MTTSTATSLTSRPTDNCHAAATILIERFVIGGGEVGGGGEIDIFPSPLHRLVHAASSGGVSRLSFRGGGGDNDDGSTNDVVVAVDEDAARERRRSDALRLLDGMCHKAREADVTISHNEEYDGRVGAEDARRRRQSSSLLRRLLLSSDYESGYTPLHRAVYNRDLTMMLLLLGHGSSTFSSSIASSTGISADITTGTNNGNSVHPLQFLNNDAYDDRDGDIVARTTNVADGTGYSSSYSLARAMATSTDREGLTPLSLLGKTSEFDLGRCRSSMSHMSSSSYDGGRRRWGWRRGLRYHDDDDINGYDGVAEPRENDDDDNVDIDFHGADDGDVVDREGGGGDDEHPLDHRRHAWNESSTECDYGCEVLTFGRADHCAMGVPGVRGGGGSGIGGPTTRGSPSLGCHKPRRVEMFGLGEMRRKWSSSSHPTTRITTAAAMSSLLNDPRPDDDDGVDSPAIAVSASTHHTLVLTRSGRLFAFGYGKSGRLGVGDARNRNLPARVLGQLTRRVVTDIAAAVDHSLCCTDDGEIFAWGSNGFGQLGHADRDDDAIAAGRLSPRRVEGGGMRQSFVVAVAAGDRHSVALTRTGEVYCWGDNRSGQLGIYGNKGDVGAVSSPVSGFMAPCR